MAIGQVTHAKVNISNPATANATSSPTHFYDYDAVGNRDSVLAYGATTNWMILSEHSCLRRTAWQ